MSLPFFSDPVRAAKGPDSRRGAGPLTEETRRDDPGGSVAEKGSEPGESAPFSSDARPAASPQGQDAEVASPTPPVAEGGFAEETVEPPASDQPIDPEPPFPVVLEDRGRPDNEGEGDFAPPEGGDDARVQEPAAQPSDARAEEENLQPPAASPPQSAAEARGDTDVAATQPFVPEPLPDEKAAEPNATSTDAPFLLSDAPADEAAPRFEVDKDGHANEDALVSDTRELHDPLSERSQEEAAASEPEPDAPAAPITAELIWSGPEETEAAPEEVHAAAPSASQAEAPTESRPEDSGSSTDAVLWQAAEPPASETRVLPAAAAIAASAPTARYEPPQVQPALGARRLGGYLRFALRIVAILVLGYAALVLLLTVLYRWVDPPASALMIAQRLSGTEIQQRWVPIRRISPHLVQAVILSEDGGFCRHRGVDWSAVEEAIESTREGVLRGGSTITMQVVKNLFLWSWRSYVRKAIEIPLAYLVELFWPKARVLEIYLNIVEWGDGIFGAEAAARHHFGKSAANLTAQEAALLAVALPNPLERHPGQPGYLVRRLASNLLGRMKTVRTTMGCVRPFASTR